MCIMTQTCTDNSWHVKLWQRLDPGLFQALADPNRVMLITRLGELGSPTTVTEAASCCPVDVSVVSRHLAVLRDAGVVTAEKRGREVRYQVQHLALARRLRELADALEACCPTECCPGGE
jgi:DNA-binding transcriptional ArsR family regulator